MIEIDVLLSCRICLEREAVYPIFETSECESILAKLTLCLKEKIEDIDGYPRSICIKCSSTIDTVCEFIHKYEETAKILNNNVVKVKTEDTEHYDDDFELESLCSILENVPKTEHVDKDPDEILSSLKDITIKRLTDDKTHINNNTEIEIEIKPEKVTLSKNIKNRLRSKKSSNKVPTGRTNQIKKNNYKKVKKKKTCDFRVDTTVKTKIDNENQKKTRDRALPGRLCEICGEVIPKNKTLRYHQKLMHLERPFKCTKCSKTYVYECLLQEHMKSHGVRNFICDICGNGFYTKKRLRNHIGCVHDKKKKVKSFKCRFCDKNFGYKRGCIIHERAVHTGERPSQCSVCDARFYDDCYLREHMRLHTGENPFKCPICSRGYAQRGNMKSHMRNHKISELDPEVVKKLKPTYIKYLRP